jgi:hypothetical protein
MFQTDRQLALLTTQQGHAFCWVEMRGMFHARGKQPSSIDPKTLRYRKDALATTLPLYSPGSGPLTGNKISKWSNIGQRTGRSIFPAFFSQHFSESLFARQRPTQSPNIPLKHLNHCLSKYIIFSLL